VNWLFIHQNFPAQFVHAARYLAAADDTVCFITQRREGTLPGVRKLVYAPRRQQAPANPLVRDFAGAVENGLAVFRVCEALKREGFQPDLVVGHNGWGEILYVKQCWPTTPLLGYFEFFHRTIDSDLDFDPEFPPSLADTLRIRTRNTIDLLGLETVDRGQTPTEWQRRVYPRHYHRLISVRHEGIDTIAVCPNPSARLWLRGGPSLSRADQVITYCARNLEPYRGFHVFMRALPELLARHPDARVLIVGGNDVSYGRLPEGAANWREKLLTELGDQLDLSRVHFLGRLPYAQYLTVLRISSVHVYLTYPFVLSWSLLEAMAAGCAVVASRTPPVEEVIEDGRNGYLVDFFDRTGLVERIGSVLTGQQEKEPIRDAARETVIDRYDLETNCLPTYVSLLRRLARRNGVSRGVAMAASRSVKEPAAAKG
jgi:glycosyltransferase involved in cell wall biosynthesis